MGALAQRIDHFLTTTKQNPWLWFKIHRTMRFSALYFIRAHPGNPWLRKVPIEMG